MPDMKGALKNTLSEGADDLLKEKQIELYAHELLIVSDEKMNFDDVCFYD